MIVALLAVGLLQQPARSAAWIPLGSHADRALLWALDAGALPRLDPLTRPWRLAAARAALETADTTLDATRWARDAVAALDDTTALVAEAGLSAYRDGGSEPMRAAGASGIALGGGLRAQIGGRNWVAVANPAFDDRWRDDPTYTGYRGGPVTGRLIEGYLALTGAVGDVSFGRMARNWGPASVAGLQLSSIAAAGDQIAGALRYGRFELLAIAQRLDDRDTLAAVRYQRWFVGHRLVMRLGEASWLALSETGVYGGPGAGFDPAMHLPVGLALLNEINDGRDFNALLGADAAIRLPGRARLELAGFIDDIQVDDSALTDERPASYGLSAGVVLPLGRLPLHLDVRYTRIASLAYRNSFEPHLLYGVKDIGIGRNAADFDESRVRLSWKPAARLDVLAEVTYLRQGSYDFRQPFPPDSVLAQPGQGFLVAPVRHASMGRVAGIAELANGLGLRGELGVVRTLTGSSRGIASAAVSFCLNALTRRGCNGFTALP